MNEWVLFILYELIATAVISSFDVLASTSASGVVVGSQFPILIVLI